MIIRTLCVLWFAITLAVPGLAQLSSLIPYPANERIIALVPLAGAGTAAQPRRPALLPADGLPPGVLSLRWIPADDGRRAIVEIVLAGDAPEIRAQLQSLGASAKWFERGKSTRAAVETELRKARADFRLEDLLPSVLTRRQQQQPGGN